MHKIAFWRTVAAGYLYVFTQLGRFFRTAGPWMAAFIALFAVGIPVSIVLPTTATQLALGITALLLMIAGYNAFAVAWHRLILLGEAHGFGENFRFGRREFRFLAYSVICVLVLALPGLALALAATLLTALIVKMTGIPQLSLVGVAAVAVLGIAVYAGAARLMLVLPAISVDEAAPYLTRTWQRTRRNTLRLFFGMLLCGVPLGLLGAGIDAASRHLAPDNIAVALLMQGVLLIANFLGLAVYVGFLSFAYDQLGGLTSHTAEQPHDPEA
jgi:hypothetical protein